VLISFSAYFRSLEISHLHQDYYLTYGLALRGLLRHHQIGEFNVYNNYFSAQALIFTDPLDFDSKCDASLPLEDMLKPSPSLRKLLEDIDRKKARVWALTNAYRPVSSLEWFAKTSLRARLNLRSMPSEFSASCTSTT
jgi:pyrimidine and pyridine-specific 5'-nucleotidase